jgi:hypothetical protein
MKTKEEKAAVAAIGKAVLALEEAEQAIQRCVDLGRGVVWKVSLLCVQQCKQALLGGRG